MDLLTQVIWLLVLPIPIACIAWTVTHEEVFREVHEYCVKRSKENKTIAGRKFFYLFTCEYCFSHYVTILFLIITDYKLLMTNWSGYVIAGFALVAMANAYMSAYSFLRIDIKKERVIAEHVEEKVKQIKED